MKDNFSTRDLHLASLCYAMNMPLIGVNREGNVCWFMFEQKEKCEKLAQQFFAKSVDVNAKDYADAFRTLKNLLFAAS